MVEKYIEDNKFDRTQFVLDIKNGKVSKETIFNILDELDMQTKEGVLENPYIETKVYEPRKKSEWNKNYLDYLVSQVASAENFTREFSEYIFKVAEYVNGTTKRMLKKIIAILIGMGVLFLAGYIVGRTNGGNSDSLKKEITSLKRELADTQSENLALSEEISSLKELNEKLNNQASEYKNKLDTIQSVFTSTNNTTSIPETKNNDELSKFIERALKGENVKTEFNNQDKYGSSDVEKRALEMGLKRNQAQLLIDNLANPKKFDINKFSE